MNLPKKLIFVLCIFLFAFASPIFANAKFDKEVSTAQKSKWHGFDKFTFKFEGKQAIFIAPSKPRSDNAWVMTRSRTTTLSFLNADFTSRFSI